MLLMILNGKKFFGLDWLVSHIFWRFVFSSWEFNFKVIRNQTTSRAIDILCGVILHNLMSLWK